jgi:hypothetical protein
MNDFTPQSDAAVDRWLAEQHHDLIRDLARILDLETGLREATMATRHAELVADLHEVLDIEAGLAAITPAASADAPDEPASPPPSPAVPAVTKDPVFESIQELARVIASFDAGRRLRLRNHPALATHASDLAHASDIAFGLVRASNLARATAGKLDRPSGLLGLRDRFRDLDRDLGRVRALGRDLELAVELDRALATVENLCDVLDRNRIFLGRALVTTEDLARGLPFRIRITIEGLARDLARASALALADALDRYRDSDPDRDTDLFDRDPDFARGLARGLARVGGLARDAARTLDRELARTRATAEELDRARAAVTALVRASARASGDLSRALHDFAGADLRGVNLTGIPLEGLRWSRTTKWPLGWAEQILLDSVEVAAGVFEVRGGTTHAPTLV